MAQRTQSEASRKAGLLTAYFKAVEKRDARKVALDKAQERLALAAGEVAGAIQKCADVGVTVGD